MASKATFTPVNRIGEPCACCGRERGPRAVRGVRVYLPDDARRAELALAGSAQYYCDVCIGQLAKAKAHR